MKKNINEYLVYGINNAISLFSSKRHTINSIILIKGGMAETHPLISPIINNKKYKSWNERTTFLKENNKFTLSNYKYDNNN